MSLSAFPLDVLLAVESEKVDDHFRRQVGVASRDELTVSDGTPLPVAVSVLIKELRRGHELPALYWSRQIEKPFYKYLWRKLATFAAEDIGTANPLAIATVMSLREAYLAEKAESRRAWPDGNFISMAVLVLARSPKNRECDHLKNVEHVLEHNGWKPEIPEYALDGHTEAGRARQLSQHEQDVEWFLESSVVVPEVGPYDARLWHLRRVAHEGDGSLLPVEQVEQWADEWEHQGDLIYGVDGVYPPPHAGQVPLDTDPTLFDDQGGES